MLDSYVDSLLDISISDSFVDYDTNGALGDIVDYSGLAVVDFVRHSMACQSSFRMQLLKMVSIPLLNSSIGLDVDDISNFVLPQVCRKLDHPLLLELS